LLPAAQHGARRSSDTHLRQKCRIRSWGLWENHTKRAATTDFFGEFDDCIGAARNGGHPTMEKANFTQKQFRSA